jgi:hypothetical protein
MHIDRIQCQLKKGMTMKSSQNCLSKDIRPEFHSSPSHRYDYSEPGIKTESSHFYTSQCKNFNNSQQQSTTLKRSHNDPTQLTIWYKCRNAVDSGRSHQKGDRCYTVASTQHGGVFFTRSKNCGMPSDLRFIKIPTKDENLERTSCEHQMCAVTSWIE